MTYIDSITALILLGFFLFGFAQLFLPAYNTWNLAMAEYYTAHTIQFIAESFRKECAKTKPNIENWKIAVSIAKELESCVLTELRKDEELVALKASCIIAGEYVEIIGLCAQ